MLKNEVKWKAIPEASGVYIFRGARNKILYVGKAGVLRDRVKSYFSNRLEQERGPRLVEAVDQAKKIETIVTDTVLEALILEANLIKKYNPPYNAQERDNKSFSFVCITNDMYPRVLVVRGRELELQDKKMYRSIFGPFPQGGVLKDAMKIIRKQFPYRDTCSHTDKRVCFNAQIGLCPAICSGKVTQKEYLKRVKEIELLFSGKKKQIITLLEKELKSLAKQERFEDAQHVKKKIFSLMHLKDIHLIKKEFAEGGQGDFRVEAYDTAHLGGDSTIGVMVVMIDKELQHAEYRTFNIKKAAKHDDYGALREILERRFNHPEWQYPKLMVIDGGKAHLNTAEKVCEEMGLKIPIVSVVKDEHHRARQILGDKRYAHAHSEQIVAVNSEAHRFSMAKHTRHRRKAFLK